MLCSKGRKRAEGRPSDSDGHKETRGRRTIYRVYFISDVRQSLWCIPFFICYRRSQAGVVNDEVEMVARRYVPPSLRMPWENTGAKALIAG